MGTIESSAAVSNNSLHNNDNNMTMLLTTSKDNMSTIPDSASIHSDSTTASSSLPLQPKNRHGHHHGDDDDWNCNACPHCADVCSNKECKACQEKSTLQSLSTAATAATSLQKSMSSYTMCQVRRHNHSDSAWLVANGVIYDATPYLSIHPGGADCILRRAGSVQDCAKDLQFHSRNGRKKWERCRLGTIRKCNGCDNNEQESDANKNKKKQKKECRWPCWIMQKLAQQQP